MGTHSPISPSSAGRWVNCPASVSLKAGNGNSTGSTASLEGEASHFAAAEMLQGRQPQPGQFAENLQVLTEEMIDCAAMYVRKIRDDSLDSGVGFSIEKRINCPMVHPESFGTPDAYGYDSSGKMLYIYDYKYGYLSIEAFENWQCVNYAAGLLTPDVTHVIITIVQPRAIHPDGHIRTWKVSRDDLMPYIARLNMMARVAMNPAEQYIKSGDHCRYCESLTTCPAASMAAASWYEFIMGPMQHELTPEQKAIEVTMLRRAAKAVEYRLNAIEEEVIHNIKSGIDVPGYSLRQCFGHLSWDLSDEEITAVGDCLDVDLRKPAAITPTQAMKLIDSDVIKQYASKKQTGFKLEPSNARKIFGGNNG